MQPVVETLSGLERRIDLAVTVADIEKEVQAQIKRLARTAKLPGFRPGKVPLNLLERSHGPSIRYDAINAEVGRAFEQAVRAAELRVAGQPTLEPKAEGEGQEGVLAFSATFEVYPEVKIPELGALEIKRTLQKSATPKSTAPLKCCASSARPTKLVKTALRLTTTVSRWTSAAASTANCSKAAKRPTSPSCWARAACCPSSKPPCAA